MSIVIHIITYNHHLIKGKVNNINTGSHVCHVSVAPANSSNVEVPKEAHGFELIQREYIKEYDSDVLFYKHKKTGNLLFYNYIFKINKCIKRS